MKKILCILLCLMMIPVSSIAADDNIKVIVDGTEIYFDQPPIIVDSRTLVPLRAIFEALGANVEWNGEIATVTAEKGTTSISLQIGSSRIYKTTLDGEVYFDIDTYARLVNNRTLVPVRAISEALGAKVEWINETKTVVITSKDSSISNRFLKSDKTENDVKYYSVLIDYPFIVGNDAANSSLKSYFENKFNEINTEKEKASKDDYEGSVVNGWFFVPHTYHLTFETTEKTNEKVVFTLYETNYSGGVDTIKVEKTISVNLSTGKITENQS